MYLIPSPKRSRKVQHRHRYHSDVLAGGNTSHVVVVGGGVVGTDEEHMGYVDMGYIRQLRNMPVPSALAHAVELEVEADKDSNGETGEVHMEMCGTALGSQKRLVSWLSMSLRLWRWAWLLQAWKMMQMQKQMQEQG